MGELLAMTVGGAFQKSRSDLLANEIWNYKHKGEVIDKTDTEYISWINSLPIFLECAHYAKLDNLIVVFEMKTPITRKAIDVLLIGKNIDGENRILLVELKQWTTISTMYVNNTNKVYVPEVKALRKHPMHQLNIYENNLRNHHSGIQKAKSDGISISFGKIAYLHNFQNKKLLYEDKYYKWKPYEISFYGSGEQEKINLIAQLHNSFRDSSEYYLLRILEDYEAVMGDEGLAGLRYAYESKSTITMKDDQQIIVDFVVEHLQGQLKELEKEIIVVSGGPGTGKTIVGIRFILEYVKLFNNGKNDNKAIFCLPKSQTVKSMFDAACAVDEEKEKEYCCYLNEISHNQNLVVVDEAHRITKLEDTLDTVFCKGTKLLILLQDDYQLVRPGEEGTLDAFRQYAKKNGIKFSPTNLMDRQILTLIDEKRCDENLLKGVTKLLYDGTIEIGDPIRSIKVFNNLNDLVLWKNNKAINSRTKYIVPFCWEWKSKDKENEYDIVIKDFRRKWNPEDTDDQVIWLNDRTDDRVACIYTSQGLDMDNVAFIWCDDLVWDSTNNCWRGNPDKLYDLAFQYECDAYSGLWYQNRLNKKTNTKYRVKNGYTISQEGMNQLIKNTYYVMLTRPRNSLGIWFQNEITKRHVLEVLNISSE